MSGASPVDEPPGKDGTQSPNPPDLPPVPNWPPGANPPGTNPPIPTPDTGTTLPPGTTPGVPVDAPPPVDDPVTRADRRHAEETAKAEADRRKREDDKDDDDNKKKK